MSTALVIEIRERGGNFAPVERTVPGPAAGQVRIEVEACGICRGDDLCRKGFWPGVSYPRIPGHEVVGIIDAVGSGVSGWSVGQRAGAGWLGGHCQNCSKCRRGDIGSCESGLINGLLSDGGYAQYMLVPAHVVVNIPGDCNWSAQEIAPLMCAGVSTFNPLRNSGVRAGELVAIQGIGGLGHLAVQFARKMGYRVAAISSGADKEELSRQLGAHHYIDTSKNDGAEALQKLGGASLILATAPNAQAIGGLVQALRMNGKMIIVAGAHEKVPVDTNHLLGHRASIMGWPGGSTVDVEDTLEFAVLFDVRPMIEVFPLKEAAQAYERMEQNKVRFRAVLDCR